MNQVALVGAVIVAAGVATGVATGSAGAAGSSFVQRTDQACAAAGAKVEHMSPDVTIAEIKKQEAIVSSLVTALKRVTPPSADAKAYKKFIAETEAQVADVRAALAAAEKQDKAKTVSELNKLEAAGSASNATARSLKLTACAKNYVPEGS
jgi:hypothetical protein